MATAEEKAAAKAAKDAEKAAAKGGTIVVNFRDYEGRPTSREYSLDVHGENFAELAEEFKASNATRIIADA